MEIFGIIFYIIIIVVFASAKKAANLSGGKNTRKSIYEAGEARKNVKPSMLEMNRDTFSQTMEGQRKTTPNKPSKGKTAIPNVPSKKRQTPVFMEPHKEERYQPKIRTHNWWGEDEHAGKRIVALRLMEGDPVPEGYERIKCPYCAADNLVTKHCKQYHSCYFCRVPID